ncbi:MAG: hypothetical protein V7K90_18155 [Nostoc sp.]|uniref:hypothetical protein n=1 Tax=Nostoc sp. TaxID=1180 RepID=UPI002FFD3C44
MSTAIWQLLYITSVGARQCRAPTGVPHVNENRYKRLESYIFHELIQAINPYLSISPKV